nr:ABC transporter permease [uncultured Sellimonas sp.]
MKKTELHVSSGQNAYLRMQKREHYIILSARILLFIIFLFLWEWTSSKGIIDSFVFSSPSKILNCFLEMTKDKSIFSHISITLYETLVSFFLVTTISILAAVILWFSKRLSSILEPYLVILNSLPKSALAPLLIVWLGANHTTIIVAGMSVAIFGSIMTLYTCFSHADENKIKLIYTLHGSPFHALTKIVVPSSVPTIISTMKVNIGLCLVGVIIGEFLAAKEGLGYLIIYSSQVFKMDWLLMSIVLLCIMAMALYEAIALFEKWYLKHRKNL